MNEENPAQVSDQKNITDPIVKLSPLELNNIKLDPKHTLLTPDYLENLLANSKKV